MIRAVFFDIGETLVDETHAWGTWCEWLGIPRLTLFGVLGQVIERRGDHREVFQILRPGLDVEAEARRKDAAGLTGEYRSQDLYPDVAACLRGVRRGGRVVGIAGNQPESTERALRALDLPVDLIASSQRWGVAKPAQDFFDRVAEHAGCPPEEIAHVGDRVDNDVLPAVAVGMRAVLVRRGPWGYRHVSWPEAARADAVIDSLAELPDLLDAW